ncbi:MAG TPA: efflux transporter outer membrane subunit [Steroidobacteraceae bacterium]
MNRQIPRTWLTVVDSGWRMGRALPPIAAAVVAAIAFSGCSLAPRLELPEVPTAASYKEPAPWTKAEPADTLPRDAWWSLYADTELDQLQQRLIANSPDLAAALARYNQARAFGDQLHSGLLPSLALSGSGQRSRQSETAPPTGAATPTFYNSYGLGVEADYELDLWGRVRNTVAAGDLSVRAAAADLESARLSLQAQLTDNFIVLRGLDRQAALLADTVTAYDRALALTRQRHDAGIVSGLDVARAQTQLDTARSQQAQNAALRATAEHAIAALVGESPSQFTIVPQSVEIRIPNLPVDLPANLLQRRPDIAAAQRRTASANASVGVARAAYFPSITLSGTYGYRSNASADWLTAPNAAWSIGPSLLLDLFDNGKRKAQVAQARAELDEVGAQYRSVVLGAFQQVEDNLALLHHYGVAGEAERSAVTSAQQSLDFAMNRYREGAVSYLEVVQSQTTMLTAEQNALDLDTRQLRASVALIRALGGGWEQGGSP